MRVDLMDHISPQMKTSIVLLLILGFVVLFGPLIAPHPEVQTGGLNLSNRFQAPNFKFVFGTDQLGRDIFSQVLFAFRNDVFASFAAVLLSVLIGVPIGIISGYFGTVVDGLLMRFTDSVLSIPHLVFPLFIASIFGAGLLSAVFAIGITWWPWYARLARSVTMSVKESEYVHHSRAMGASRLRIMWLHVLPATKSSIIIQSSLDIGYAVLTIATLSYLGVGAKAPTPEFGLMLSSYQQYALTHSWLIIFPAVATIYLVFTLNYAGDALRDVLGSER